MSIKILLVDDHPFTRAGVRAIVETDKSIDVVGEAVDGLDAISKVKAKQPEIVVMDITMPNLSGIDAVKEILKDSPYVKIIALSIHSGVQFVKEMLNAGAVGYLLKDEAPEELLQAIKKVSKGEMFLSSAITRAALSKTKKEVDISSVNILQTKLHRPPIMNDYVVRERIIEELEKNIGRPLSVISAGAGYGKSVTVSEWLERTCFLHTWLSLDNEHNDFRAFLLYLCAAIEKIFPGSLENTGNLLTAGDLPPFKVISNSLINELCDIDQDFILVLDDYHMIRERKIHQLFDKWLRFPPPNIHLSIISRRDPPLDIKALRSNNRMTEIRMNDLGFSDKEIASLFKKLLGIDLSDQAIKKLQEKTEGWIIGLRMASLTIKDQEDIDRLLEAVEGDLHNISDYLISEVLSKQPQHIQDQLIDSSVLNRFCAELIGEIMLTSHKAEQEISDGKELIQWLIKSNMFVIPLDTERNWFRYHHLFQDLLQNQLHKKKAKKQISEMHNKASKWFEKKDLIAEAIEHSMKAKNTNRAVKIVTDHWEDSFDSDQWYSVEGWLNYIPEHVIIKSVNLLTARLWITHKKHKVSDVPRIIKLIEQNGSVLTNKETGYLAFGKSMVSLFNNRKKEALKYAEQALKLIPKKHFIFRADTYGWWTVAMQVTGKGEQAIESAIKAVKNLDPPGEPVQLTRRTIHPNFIHLTNADIPSLHQCIEMFFKIPKISPYMLAFGWYFRGCVSWWQNDHEGVIRSFKQTIKYRYICRPLVAVEAYHCTAMALLELNQSTAAKAMMNQGVQFAERTSDPVNIAVMAAGQIRLSLKQGELESAEKWLNSVQFSGLGPSMLWWVEVPSITQCRVLIAIATPDSLTKSVNLLKGYLAYSESIFNKLRIIEIAVLQAQTYFKLQNESDAINALRYALELAVNGEFIRPFIEVAKELGNLFKNLKEQNIKPRFIDEILNHLIQKTVAPTKDAEMQIQKFKEHKKENLVLFTPKEIDVLRCIEEGLRTQEIASKLFNSEGTIKKHVSNMFQKMNVRNRLSLISRAKDTGILKSDIGPAKLP